MRSLKITLIGSLLFKFHTYIFKIEIRNTEIYLSEVSVSSTTDISHNLNVSGFSKNKVTRYSRYGNGG